eukprot:5928630-Prymnesium_polylepis.2
MRYINSSKRWIRNSRLAGGRVASVVGLPPRGCDARSKRVRGASNARQARCKQCPPSRRVREPPRMYLVPVRVCVCVCKFEWPAGGYWWPGMYLVTMTSRQKSRSSAAGGGRSSRAAHVHTAA